MWPEVREGQRDQVLVELEQRIGRYLPYPRRFGILVSVSLNSK